MRIKAFVIALLSIAETKRHHHRRGRREISSRHRRRRENAPNPEYKLKIHKNAIDTVDENGKGGKSPRSFLNFDKEDRVMMAQLSPIGGRRYLHLKKMIDFIFQNRNTTSPPLTDFWGYGCWCIAHGENPLLAKRGLPADPIDSVCKDHALCYECARMDYGHTCDPTQVGYEVIGNKDLVTGKRFLSCGSNSDVCQKCRCMCDKMLAEGLLRNYEQWDEKYHISQSGFDGRADCELPEPIHDWGNLDQCCGEYPLRAPYRSDNGNRQCCVDKTYHTYYLECCDNEVKTKGFCTPQTTPAQEAISTGI